MPYPDALKPRPLKQRENGILVVAREFGRPAVYSRIAYYFEGAVAIGYGFSVRLIATGRHLFQPNDYTARSNIDLRHKLNLAIPLSFVALVDANSIDP